MARFFLSTAIPYVNAPPHIGHALELVQADALARHHRQLGEETFFVTGTDENAIKNVQAAEKAGEPVADFVARHSARFGELCRVLGISNDDFIRTTEERHVKGATKLWRACEAAGDIYKKRYSGLYCTGCEAFITSKELQDGLCPEHKIKPQVVEEENYFFKLSRYQNQLADLIESDQLRVVPVGRKNEMLEFIRQGLEDFSISRSRERAKNWGIAVPGDDSQVMYVWFDALTNYINALGYADDSEKFAEFWRESDQTVHLVGKGITRFHAIYWPAMLLSAGLTTPSSVLVHGYINVDGEKMSKSLGNVVDPFMGAQKHGAEPLRYFLLREFSSIEDGDFSWKNLENRYNTDLANGLGNLVQRVAILVATKMSGKAVYTADSQATEASLVQVLDDTDYQKAFEQFRLHDATASVWEKIALANAYLNDRQPWKQEGDAQDLTLITTVAMIAHVAWLLQPFMPDTARKVAAVFGVPLATRLDDGQHVAVTLPEPLFPRTEGR